MHLEACDTVSTTLYFQVFAMTCGPDDSVDQHISDN